MNAFVDKEPFSRRLKLGLQLLQPKMMREITSTHERYTFKLSPSGNMSHIHIFARGPAVFGVNVKISDKFHLFFLKLINNVAMAKSHFNKAFKRASYKS